MAKRSAYRGAKRTRMSAPKGADLATISTDDLAREMARRHREVRKLQRRRDKLAEQLAEVDEELRAVGATLAVEPGRKRPRNTQNLADALVDVLKNKTMTVTEAAEAVKSAGYMTTSANFRTIVNQTLIKDKRFENVSRGKYRAK